MMNKETIKEFFRLTREKFILWIILFLISPVYLVDLVCLSCLGCDCQTERIVPLLGGGFQH